MQTAIEHFSGRTLVGRLVGTTPSRPTVREWIESALGGSPARILELSMTAGLFLLQLSDSVSTDALLARSPIFSGSRLLVFQRWTPQFDQDELDRQQQIPRFPMQGIATESFQKIREAYEILSDERKRKIYDLYGMEGLSSGMELGSKVKSVDEFLKEFEKLKKHRREHVMSDRVRQSGSLVVNVSLAENSPVLKGMTSATELEAHISKKSSLVLGGNISIGQQLGGGTLSALFRHHISSDANVEIVAMAGLRSLAVIFTCNWWNWPVNVFDTSNSQSDMAMFFTIGIHGISYKFRFSRGGQKFTVPILLTGALNPLIATGALLFPTSIYFVLKTCLLKPYFLQRREAKKRERRRSSATQIHEARAKASKAQSLLKNVADRKREKQLKNGGLVIKQALYGSAHELESNYSGVSPEEEDDIPPPVLDVTTTLNFLVENEQLQLHEGVKKAGLIGFCDPCPGERKKLKVVVGDFDELIIPDTAHE
ncbi:hypothetical protein L7F22_028333 [Adiantum nelumboides]|nr:hypothetical protein [Adiantum nelumboides]